MLSSVLALVLSLADGDLIEDFEGAASEGWERIVSDAHPPYNLVERVHDPEQAKSGSQYLHVRTLGGFTGVCRSAKHPWPVEAGRPYRASVWARLTGTRTNVAVLSLSWVNAAGELLGDQRSAPLAKTEGWTLLSIEVPLSPAGAAGVLPGLHFEGSDVRGLCDFDLLELVPVVRLELRPAGRRVAAFTSDEYPRFALSPAGLPPGVHTMTASLALPEGKTVVRTATIDVPSSRSASVDFPPAPPGVHLLTASIDGQESHRSLAVLVTAPGRPLPPLDFADRSSSRVHDSVEAALRRRILEGRPIVLDPLFFDPDGNPTAGAFALVQIDQILAGAVPVADPGLFPAELRTVAFRTGSSMAFALWSESGEVDLPLTLNEGAVLQPLQAIARGLSPGDRVRISSMPVFILGVDPLLTELRLELSSGELPLQLSPVRVAVRLRNTSPGASVRDLTVSLGELPAGWRASARRFTIPALAPRADHEEALDLILPPTETERPVDLKIDLAFTVQGKDYALQVLRRVVLRSPLRLETTLIPGPPKTLRIRVLNGTDHPMTLMLRSRIPGLPERQEVIRDLAPGSRSKAFDYAVPEPGSAELSAQEAGGDRAVSRRLLPLR